MSQPRGTFGDWPCSADFVDSQSHVDRQERRVSLGGRSPSALVPARALVPAQKLNHPPSEKVSMLVVPVLQS